MSSKLTRNVIAAGSTTKYANTTPSAKSPVATTMKRPERALGRLVDRGSEEAPDLPDEDRQHDRDRREAAHLDRRRERLDDAERDERLVGRERPLEPLDQLRVEVEADQERRHDRERRRSGAGAAAPSGARRRSPLRPCRAGAGRACGSSFVEGVRRRCPARAARARQVRRGRPAPRAARPPSASSSFESPVTESLNSLIPLPSWRPISGSRLGPKTRSSTSRRIRSSQMPIPKGMRRTIAVGSSRIRARDGSGYDTRGVGSRLCPHRP